MYVCLKFFWSVIFGSLIAETNLSCVRCKHSFKELKYIIFFISKEVWRPQKYWASYCQGLRFPPAEKELASWSCNHIPKAEQRLEEGLKKQRQIIAKFKSKDKKGVSSIYITYEHCDTEKLSLLILLKITLPWFHLKPTCKFLALALTLRNGYSFRTLEAILMESKSLLGKK